MHRNPDHQRVSFRFATANDIERYYGTCPYQTLRAVVLLLNDEPAAVIGVARDEDHAQFFGDYRDTFVPHMKSMTTLRAIKRAMRIVAESHLPVFALADEEEPDSERLLTRLGFAPVPDRHRLYQWSQ